ncbi:prefoldin subunit 3 [Dermacentor silvarum]|uniref:prefoldin subunit 3 n=1 Tax=Dermacentor silvarum TaxID=543639 RepID=UPI0018978A9B|nr:prefoldin subunit 3 [Dermacentor silvarum]
MTDPVDAEKATKKLVHAGIPKAECLDDMDEFMAREENQTIDAALKNLDEQHSKYKFMELNLLQKKQRLKSQIPEIKTSLEIIKLLKSKRDSSEDMETRFVLSDQVYSKAVIPPTERVCLWLGANVMLEYTLEGAEELLCKNLQTATRNFTELHSDLDFLRDQITTTEVNMARLHNWNVKKVQAEKLIAQSLT